MLVSEYTEYDALGLAELVANGDISAEELVDCAEQQYHSKNPAFKCRCDRNVGPGPRGDARRLANGTFPRRAHASKRSWTVLPGCCYQ